MKNHTWLKKYPTDVNWNSKIEDKSMNDMFNESIAKFGDKTYLNFMGKKYSFKEMGQLVDNMAANLQKQGIGKGSKVGLCLPNSPFYVISYFATLKTGATVVNFNPLYPASQLEELVKNTDTNMMICLDSEQAAGEKMYPKVAKLLETTKLEKIVACNLSDVLPFGKKWLYKTSRLLTNKELTKKAKIKKDGRTLSFTKLLKDNGKPTPVTIDPKEDIAVYQFTGGTTGVPKAAMLTHANLTANTTQTKEWFTNLREGEEKLLAVLPFFHVFAMTVEMNMTLITGTEVIMLPKFEINETLSVITKEKPTVFAGVPTLYHAINSYPDIGKYDLSSLKTCIAGGAALSKETKDAFEKLSGCSLFEGYGLSETSPVATANPLKKEFQKAGSIGLPVPNTKISIRDPEFPEKEMEINVKGEICLSGPQVMKGYLNKPDETAEAMTKDGFFRTGDIGYMDEEGYVFIVDRIKDMIIASGFNIYPRKVEDALLKHDNISEAIVAGVKDPYRGETVKAWIVTKDGTEIDFNDLKVFLKDKLSKIECPKQVEFRKELPKTMIGKPDKKALLAEEAKKEADEKVSNTNKPALKKKPPTPKH